MPALSLEDWARQYGYSVDAPTTYNEWAKYYNAYETGTPYETPYNPDSPGNPAGGGSSGGGGSPSPLFNSPLPENTVAPGIPAYNGWHEPDYNARSQMPNHWLNTMNAFAPTARNEMQGLLGMGALNQPRTPYPNPTPAPQPFTPPTTPLKPVSPNSNGTVGIDPSGRLRFDTDYYGGTQNLPTTQPAQPLTQQSFTPTGNGTVGVSGGRLTFAPTTGLLGSGTPTRFTGMAPGLMDAFYVGSGK